MESHIDATFAMDNSTGEVFMGISPNQKPIPVKNAAGEVVGTGMPFMGSDGVIAISIELDANFRDQFIRMIR